MRCVHQGSCNTTFDHPQSHTHRFSSPRITTALLLCIHPVVRTRVWLAYACQPRAFALRTNQSQSRPHTAPCHTLSHPVGPGSTLLPPTTSVFQQLFGMSCARHGRLNSLLAHMRTPTSPWCTDRPSTETLPMYDPS
jgi:hypothetical protein